MCPRRSHLFAPLVEAASNSKGRNILLNESIESYFKELKCVVFAETLLSYPDWKLPFTVRTDACDKQLGAAISQNYKTIFFSSK